MTKGTLRATEEWTDGRHAADDKCVALDSEVAEALAIVTESVARSTVLRVTKWSQVTGSWHGKRWLMVLPPKSWNDPSFCATTHTCDTQKKVQGRKGIEGQAHGVVIESD